MSFPKTVGEVNKSWICIVLNQKATPKENYLSPVFEEVFPKYVLGGVFMVQHLWKERCHLLGIRTELHVLSCWEKQTNTQKACSQHLDDSNQTTPNYQSFKVWIFYYKCLKIKVHLRIIQVKKPSFVPLGCSRQRGHACSTEHRAV